MKHRKNDQYTRFDNKIDSIRKESGQYTTNLWILAKAQKRFRVMECARD